MRPSAPAVLTVAALAVTALTAGPSSAAVFTTPVVVTAADLRDPILRVDPSGTLYLGAVPGLPTASTIFQSSNGGMSWTVPPLDMRTALPGGQAFDLTISPNGRLATTDAWGASATVATSSTSGTTWTARPFQGGVALERPWVADAGIAIRHVAHELGVGIVLSTSTDGGLTYPERTVIASDATRTCICPSGNVVADGSRVAVVYSTGTGITVYRTVNGVTSAHVAVDPAGGLDTLGAFPVIAHPGGDTLVAVWLETSASTSRVRFSRSTNFGSTWSAPVSVVSTGASAYPWVAVRGSRVGISLYHSTATGAPGSVGASATWHESYVESFDTGASWGTLTVADPTAVKTGPICTDGLDCASEGELGTLQTVAFDTSGRPILAYLRSLGGSDTEVRFTRGT